MPTLSWVSPGTPTQYPAVAIMDENGNIVTPGSGGGVPNDGSVTLAKLAPGFALPAANVAADVATQAELDAIGIARGSSLYYLPLVATTGTVLLVADQEYMIPFDVQVPMTCTRIGVEVTTAGSANAVIRLGIRAGRTVDSRPQTLTIDAGTVDATTTGFKEITISQALPRGIHWLSTIGQGSPTTQATVRTVATPAHPAVSLASYSSTLRVGLIYTPAQSGAFISSLVQGSITVANSAPLVALRA